MGHRGGRTFLLLTTFKEVDYFLLFVNIFLILVYNFILYRLFFQRYESTKPYNNIEKIIFNMKFKIYLFTLLKSLHSRRSNQRYINPYFTNSNGVIEQ